MRYLVFLVSLLLFVATGCRSRTSTVGSKSSGLEVEVNGEKRTVRIFSSYRNDDVKLGPIMLVSPWDKAVEYHPSFSKGMGGFRVFGKHYPAKKDQNLILDIQIDKEQVREVEVDYRVFGELYKACEAGNVSGVETILGKFL